MHAARAARSYRTLWAATRSPGDSNPALAPKPQRGGNEGEGSLREDLAKAEKFKKRKKAEKKEKIDETEKIARSLSPCS